MGITRRMLHALIAGGLASVIFVTSGPAGVAPIGIASAHAGFTPPPPVVGDNGRFLPTIHAPKLQTGVWQAPAAKPKDPALKSVAAASGVSPNPAQGRTPGEQQDLRTENTETFLNSDGTWTLKVASVPTHFQDAQGHWQNIDNTLAADNSDQGFGYGNKANGWHVHFATTTHQAYVMHLQASGVALLETLDGAGNAPASVNGRQITYPSVMPGVDLLYGLGNMHVEETLLLHDAQAPASYTFTYHVPGVVASQDEAGNITLTDAHDGHLVLEIGGTQMYEADAQGQMVPTGAGTEAVRVTLAGSGPDFSITLTPDHAWLSDPARHFPVAIDPTIGPLTSATTTDNTSSGNTYSDTLDESANTTWSFYDNPDERMGNCNTIPSSATGYGTGTNRSYIKFPLGTLPTHAHVTYGTLTLYQVSAFGGATGITANTILTAWNATTLTWGSHPTSFSYAGSGTAHTSYNISTTDVCVEG